MNNLNTTHHPSSADRLLRSGVPDSPPAPPGKVPPNIPPSRPDEVPEPPGGPEYEPPGPDDLPQPETPPEESPDIPPELPPDRVPQRELSVARVLLVPPPGGGARPRQRLVATKPRANGIVSPSQIATSWTGVRAASRMSGSASRQVNQRVKHMNREASPIPVSICRKRWRSIANRPFRGPGWNTQLEEHQPAENVPESSRCCVSRDGKTAGGGWPA